MIPMNNETVDLTTFENVDNEISRQLREVGRHAQTVHKSQKSRRSFLSMGAAFGAAALSTVGLNRPSYAQSSFPGSNAEFSAAFQSIQEHENYHVSVLVHYLGNQARPKPTFKNLKQSSMTNFITAARTFENTGTGAYLYAAPYIWSQFYLMLAGAIALVEGRHSGFLQVGTGLPITENNEDIQHRIPPQTVVSGVMPYIQSLNGGPAPTYDFTRSATNDLAILNFALLLEYLEAEYYNINVPIFFPSSTSNATN